MRQVFILLLLSLLTVGLAGCSGSGAPPEEDTAVSPSAVSIDTEARLEEGADEKAPSP